MFAWMRTQARRLVLQFFPALYHWRAARYWRTIFRRDYFPAQTSTRKLLYGEKGEIKVLTGPFEGMKYFDEVFYFSGVPRWLGVYEMELHPVVQQIKER
jgi:hypothetical protein